MAQTRKGGLGRGLAALIPTGPAGGGPGLGTAAADVIIGTSAPTTDAAAVEDRSDTAAETEAPAKASKPAKKAPAKAPRRRRRRPRRRRRRPDDVVATAPTPAPAVRTDGEPLSPTGAVYHEIPPLQIQAQPQAAAQRLRRGGARRAGALDPRVRSQCSRSWCAGSDRSSTARHGRASVAGQPARRARDDPRDRRETTDDSMLRDALLENIPSGAAQSARRGSRVPATPRGVRGHPRGVGVPDRTFASGCDKHDPTPQVADSGAAAGRGGRPVRGARTGAAVARGRRRRSGGTRGTHRRRGHVVRAPRKRSCSPTVRAPPLPRR